MIKSYTKLMLITYECTYTVINHIDIQRMSFNTIKII